MVLPREVERPGSRPTFPEFLEYLEEELSPDPGEMARRKVNNHWKPIYVNCRLCHQRWHLKHCIYSLQGLI